MHQVNTLTPTYKNENKKNSLYLKFFEVYFRERLAGFIGDIYAG